MSIDSDLKQYLQVTIMSEGTCVVVQIIISIFYSLAKASGYD